MQTPKINKGTLLIARPSLMTDVFHRAVVLITEHSTTGTVGFILNKPIEQELRDLLADVKSDMQVYEGGPVDQENLYYIHSRPDLISGSERIGAGLFWGGNYKDVNYAINNGFIEKTEIRFYLGYSGWSGGQLENEIQNNSWEVINNEKLDIFADWNNNLWKKQMKKLGGDNLLWMNMPENPMSN